MRTVIGGLLVCIVFRVLQLLVTIVGSLWNRLSTCRTKWLTRVYVNSTDMIHISVCNNIINFRIDFSSTTISAPFFFIPHMFNDAIATADAIRRFFAWKYNLKYWRARYFESVSRNLLQGTILVYAWRTEDKRKSAGTSTKNRTEYCWTVV
jgi:hypothetical protein